ncbi:MAG: hypothetical protein ABS36_01350 [Acidobacteria bacterium SCN 69-37]|nr:MAG: hypothetical protein ABS36_01350 [Acidobacteria bacterium SCN 69-37]
MVHASLDFAYPWWLSYGHVVLALAFGVVLAAAVYWSWRPWLRGVLVGLTLWAVAGSVVMLQFNARGVPALPTANYLRHGAGARVLDIGAGTGRSSIMVLRERPGATLVAFDEFGESFAHHFDSAGRPEDRLLANLRTAGVAGRTIIESGDMRALPFDDASFDAIVSAYAMDHIGADGARRALVEAYRVLEPGGEFLLMLVHNDVWTTIAFGPLLSHGGLRGSDWWRSEVAAAGFDVIEEGTRLGTLFFLLEKDGNGSGAPRLGLSGVPWG